MQKASQLVAAHSPKRSLDDDDVAVHVAALASQDIADIRERFAEPSSVILREDDEQVAGFDNASQCAPAAYARCGKGKAPFRRC